MRVRCSYCFYRFNFEDFTYLIVERSGHEQRPSVGLLLPAFCSVVWVSVFVVFVFVVVLFSRLCCGPVSDARRSSFLQANNRTNANETNSHVNVVVVLNLPVRINFFLLERSEFPVRESPLGPDRYRSCRFAPTQRQKERHELLSACNSSSSKWNRQMSKGSSSPRRARR